MDKSNNYKLNAVPVEIYNGFIHMDIAVTNNSYKFCYCNSYGFSRKFVSILHINSPLLF